ncbi:MAG: DUF2892 domain-containing protein [Saprospiraceae bacterium]|nr:DUF2892 domain-containing protein [Saprospiraceae bacterium]
MNRTQIIRLFAGALILISVSLAHFLHPNWMFLAVFVGLNLFQSALTKWCLLEDILKKLKVKGECE